MGSESVYLEKKLESLLGQLQTESGILDRMIYKNKNQHRRCLYFQYLLKVRRDVRLLQSARLEEILHFLFQVIDGKRPTQTVQLLESLKRRKCNNGKHNFLERLLGAARLLSQMVEPMVQAAVEISTLLARSFFMGFSLTILALLARLRVLVQQILLDVVSVFNKISSLSQRKQSIKLTQGGIEVFREYYPSNVEVITLECIWERDKFVLLERTNKCVIENQGEDLGPEREISLRTSTTQYQSIEALLGDEELGDKKMDTDYSVENLPGTTNSEQSKTDASVDPSFKIDNETRVEDCGNDEGYIANTGSPNQKFAREGSTVLTTSPSPTPISRKKVAFISVKSSTSSETNEGRSSEKAIMNNWLSSSPNKNNDSFFNLLTGGNMKDSLF